MAATGAVLLAGAAQAQIPESVGDGIPTGQMGVQLFNYGNFLRDGQRMGDASPITVDREDCRETAPQDVRRSDDCAWYRTGLLFDFLRSKGVDVVELFGHQGFPGNDEIDGDYGLMAYRALLDQYGLHAGGWHGSMNESQWTARVNAAKILGADYIGSGGVGGEGINSYGDTLLTAQALNRLGKQAVEAGVGPAYIHNHTSEFDRRYVDDGVEKYAYDILMERTDPRYVVGELDVFWSSDAFNDVTGEASADFIEKHGSRIQMLHIKDGVDIAGQPSPTNSRSGDPETTGTGELDFRPIFAAAEGLVRYYHQEHDGGTLTDADVSLTNLKGRGPQVVATLHAKPQSFPSVPAGTAAADNVVPVLVQNTGDVPLEIEDIDIDNHGSPDDADDFDVVSENCTEDAGGFPLNPGNPNATPPLPRGMCVVNVGFAPTKTNYTSVALLEFESNSDSATEQVLLVGTSGSDALSTVGGEVPSVLQLSVGNAASFGTFTPGLAKTYTTALAAAATSTAGDAALSVTDPSSNAPGHLVNGTFALAQPLGVRAVGLGDPADTPYSEVGGTPVALKSWSTPVTAAPLTVGLSQAIGGTDALRAGTYSKTLTFTLSTTTP